MTMFVEHIFAAKRVDITQAILDQIKQDRARQQIDKEIVKKCIQVFVDVGLVQPKPMKTAQSLFVWQGDRNLSEYDDHFEAEFLRATQRES